MHGGSSPSSSSSLEQQYCQVCEQPAFGNHFGALSCRACAAFFRRAVLNKKKKKNEICERTQGKCGVLVQKRRSFCKVCRLEECVKVGMSPEHFQFDHDLISASRKIVVAKEKKIIYLSKDIPPSMELFVGRPNFLISLEPDLASPIKNTIDVSFLLEKAENVFRKGVPLDPKLLKMTGLEKMAFGLNAIRTKDKNEKFMKLTKIGRNEAFHVWETDFLAAANWFSYCDDFHKLPETERMQILKCAWKVWVRLQRLALTADMRMKKKCNEEMAMMANETTFDWRKVEVDVSWFTNYSKEQLAFYLNRWGNEIIGKIIRPLMQLQPSAVEQSYMLAQISFQLAGKIFQGSILEATERIHENISNDIHNYYTKEMKMPNYSARLMQLMKINHMVQNDVIDVMEREKIGRIFDVFTVEFSHPEMFYWQK